MTDDCKLMVLFLENALCFPTSRVVGAEDDCFFFLFTSVSFFGKRRNKGFLVLVGSVYGFCSRTV
jgi:hypothetical protein